MSLEDLPSEFDIIVLGTGLTETIVAAAFSRIGLKVLHLDRNEYYGGTFANLSLQGLDDLDKNFEENQPKSDEEISKLLNDGETLINLPSSTPPVQNIKREYNVRHRTPSEVLALSKKSSFPAAVSTTENEECKNENKEDLECGNTSDSENAKSEAFVKDETEKSESEKTRECGDTEIMGSKDETSEEREREKDEEGSTSNISTQEEKNTDEDVAKNETSNLQPAAAIPKNEWTVERIEEEGRRFCFDLSPSVLFCTGEMVELLIQSDVARYCEFRTVSRVLTFLKGTIEQVPCSRADVFSSKSVSLIEKRLMMKFLQFAADFENSPDEYKDFIGKPFHEFLSSKKLSANVKHFIQNAIAMVTDAATTEDGLRKTKMFLRSLGRYGNTAFLFPLYGSGELPQGYSRLSAVFGGTYCLSLTATHLITDQDKRCSGIITSSGKKVSCKYLIGETSYLPSSFVQTQEDRTTSRAILITDKSVSPSDEPELSLLNFVCEDDRQRPVTVLELPYSASVCPKGVFIVHLTRDSVSKDFDADFAEVKKKLFGDHSDESKPKILWAMHFSQPNRSQVSLSDNAVENVFVASGGGDSAVDVERVVNEAKTLFHKVCPDEEFLAKPPNPEDIILVDDEEKDVSGKVAEGEDIDQENEEGKEGPISDEVLHQEKLDHDISNTEPQESKVEDEE